LSETHTSLTKQVQSSTITAPLCSQLECIKLYAPLLLLRRRRLPLPLLWLLRL